MTPFQPFSVPLKSLAPNSESEKLQRFKSNHTMLQFSDKSEAAVSLRGQEGAKSALHFPKATSDTDKEC